jgi:hypothetical protein
MTTIVQNPWPSTFSVASPPLRRTAKDALDFQISLDQSSRKWTRKEILLGAKVTESIRGRKRVGAIPVAMAMGVQTAPTSRHASVTHASSMIRREVASAITRKETPELRFTVLPAGAAKVGEAS